MATTEAPPPEAAPVRPAHRFGHVRALDGVRGLAVALVVLYHFAPTLVPAGFVGVDVFFVLSGFLITSLALGEHDRTASISAGAFYARRARRLLPAAVTTVVVTVVVAVLVQPSSTRAALRGDGVASLLYVANWWSIAQDDSYQAAFGTESPLAHFWSLAVEEQFYLLFPLALLGVVVLLRRRGADPGSLARTLLVGAAVGAVASAVLMAWVHDPAQDPSRAYFGTATRLQAPLLGVAGAAAWWLWGDALRHRSPTRALTRGAVVALGFLALVSLRADFRSGWLYEAGFLLVAAAALVVVLASCAGPTGLSRLLGHRSLVVLGLYSYSIYLWHWPVRVLLSADTTPLSGLPLFVARVAVTGVAAVVSYRFVETPFRHSSEPRRVAVVWLLAVPVAALAVWAIARPVPAPATDFSTEAAPVVDDDGAAGDAAAAPTEPIEVLWLGDSVAWTLGGGHLDYPRPVGYDSPFDPDRMLIWNKADYSCPLVPNLQRSFGVEKKKEGWCVERDTSWPPLLDEFSPDVVAWSASMFDTYEYKAGGRWLSVGSPEWDALYRANLESARRVATSQGALFVLLGQPDPIANPDEQDQESLLPENIWRYGHVRDLQRRFAAAHPADTRFIDMQPMVCPDDSCASMTLADPGGRPDGVHFTFDAAVAVAGPLEDAFEQAVGRTPAGG